MTHLSETIIEVSGVWFSFNGQYVLEGVNLKVERGDFLVVIGPNAGGKTVVLKTLGLFSLMMSSGMFLPAARACS